MGTPKKTKKYCHKTVFSRDLPGGPVPANAGDTGSIPGPGRDHMWQLSPCARTTEPACLEPVVQRREASGSPHTARGGPCSPHLEKARAQQRRPGAAKHKDVHLVF